jgi:hypothetical protein
MKFQYLTFFKREREEWQNLVDSKLCSSVCGNFLVDFSASVRRSESRDTDVPCA